MTSADASLTPSPRVRVRRHADRAHYDRRTVDAILDAGLICHLGVVIDGQPVVLPTGFCRCGDVLYLHGAPANRSLDAALQGACVTVTHLDGLVLARAAMNHSMNYRSAVVMGKARLVDDPVEKRAALTAVVEHLVPGRSAEVREMTATEVARTLVVALDLAECSAKVRGGPPVDDEADLFLPVWAGVIPLRPVAGPAQPEAGVSPDSPEPASVAGIRARFPEWSAAEDAAVAEPVG
jgi:nitroimidazol reductase NimA-like FMN-containing flavoprotein (pyridoxamine 5'-phosphate oxidase superfamily)